MNIGNIVKKIAKHASKSEARFELTAVELKDGTLTATDSFRLLSYKPWTYQDKKTADIPADALLSAAAILKAKIPQEFKVKPATLTAEEEAHRIVSDDGEWRIPHVEGKFPNWKMCIPELDKEPLATFDLNAEYLKDMADALKDMNSLHSVTVKFYGKGQPVVFQAKGHLAGEATGVIMPLRG